MDPVHRSSVSCSNASARSAPPVGGAPGLHEHGGDGTGVGRRCVAELDHAADASIGEWPAFLSRCPSSRSRQPTGAGGRGSEPSGAGVAGHARRRQAAPLIPKAELGSVGTRLNLGPYSAQILANGWFWPDTAGQHKIVGSPSFTWWKAILLGFQVVPPAGFEPATHGLGMCATGQTMGSTSDYGSQHPAPRARQASIDRSSHHDSHHETGDYAAVSAIK